MDIWKGRCRERACIVIDKLVGRKMERISKHFFAFILNYFSFSLWQVCDGVKDGEFPLRKASFWFFHEIKCSAFWGVGNLSQNLNLVNLKICRRCPKKIIPKISWRQEEMYYCTTYRNNVLSNSGFFGTFRGDRFWNCGFSVSWKSDRTTPTMIYNGGVQPVSLLYNYVLVL